MARKQDWSPREPGARPRFKPFEDMARDMVGDGKTPDLFFVSVAGNIVTVSLDFQSAYEEWRVRSRGNRVETSLEDRLYGTIASVEPEDDGSPKLIRHDDSADFVRGFVVEAGYQPEE